MLLTHAGYQHGLFGKKATRLSESGPATAASATVALATSDGNV
jgi:hypothetical protein